ncbi:unnamed protein product [Ambrosiozyma monospora]|uniref:Unnamed protein product n=1 Tax=Ambrosiozyma monospora TaxID=43982 RepID=A0ACB5TFE6_AMBMO|nr:unnamed protein product [Ambrosiozyma monospora]
MWKLVQSGLSVVAGTAEPEYGPEAIHPVCADLKEGEPLYQPIDRSDLKYQTPEGTNVETQTFYFQSAEHFGFAQIIHSDVMGISTTSQFTFKVFEKTKPDEFVWTSTHLENFAIVQDGVGFKADDLKIELSEDGKTYTVHSAVTKESLVDLKFELIGEGVKFGKNGATIYGTDVNEPWGSMRHIFWPRCHVTGTIELLSKQAKFAHDPTDATKSVKLQFDDVKEKALGMYVFALQGMKPHHAAATWNFLNYYSDDYTVTLMEFTTPKAYNSTLVTVAITVDSKGEVVLGSIDNKTNFVETEHDDESGWDFPRKIQYIFKGQNSKKQPVEIEIGGELKNLSEKVDVMFEIPQFVKNIVSGVAGTKPFIYQFSNELKLKLTVDGVVKKEEVGYGYNESSFVTEA